ncbi:hypothetical protein Ptr902_11750 [Pyrenophora tritici-repentis]|nr:hypothetical protein L13192_02786 [Pyrenophora tritici-repentis]KAI2476766.1 hypothetical protein Ptr902_11750 [Pyrenophora tritici-repentis]
MPGGSNINHFRMANPKRYSQDCDMTIVVAKLFRLADDSSFRTLYMEAYRRRRSGSVILVATRSDELIDTINPTISMDATAEDQIALMNQKSKELPGEQNSQIAEEKNDSA